MQEFFIIISILCLVYSGWFIERLLAEERKRKLLTSGILLVALALLATLPRYAPGYTPVLMTTFIMYIILAVSWALFSGPTGYMSLATSAFFGIGLYAAAILVKLVPLPVFTIAGGLASFIVALLVGALTLRLRGIYFAIFTFGLVILIMQIILYVELQIFDVRGHHIFTQADNNTIYYAMLGVFVALVITAYFIRRSKYGLALQSIGEYEEAAAHMGVNVTMVKVITFAISAFFMGAAGAIWATRLNYIDPYFAFNVNYSFLPVLMAIFGGIGQLHGPVLGAAIFAYLQDKLITNLPYYYMLIFGIVLVAAILYLPNGIVGLIQKLWKRGWGGQHADT